MLNVLPLLTDGEVFLWRERLSPCALGVCAPVGMMGCDKVPPGRELGAWCRVQSCSQIRRESRAANEAASLEKALPSRRPFSHLSPRPLIIIIIIHEDI